MSFFNKKMKMKKGHYYIIGGITLLGVASAIYFLSRGKEKSKYEKQ